MASGGVMQRAYRRPLCIAIAMLAVGCHANQTGPSEPELSNVALTVVSGDAQVGEVGKELELPVRIRVTRDGIPVAGAEITWKEFMLGTIGGDPVTDATGHASARWTMPEMVGAKRAWVSVGPLGAQVSVRVEAMAQPGPVTQLTVGTDRFATGGRASVWARATDRFGNGVPDHDVTARLMANGRYLATFPGSTWENGLATLTIPLEEPSGASVYGPLTVAVTDAVGRGAISEFSHTHFRVDDGSFDPADFYGYWSPRAVTVKVGTTVYWGAYTGGHGVRIVGVGLLDDGRAQLQGTMVGHRFDQPGNYAFYCHRHPYEADAGGIVSVVP